MKIRDRIKELRRVKAKDLIPNPANWRTHPKKQADALKGLLSEIGYANALLARETPEGLQIIDGHLRAETTPDTVVPVLVLDVNEQEAKKLLLSLDPLAAMAEADSEALKELLAEVDTENDAVQTMFDGLAKEYDAGPGPTGLEDPGPRLDVAEKLREQWGVERGQLWLMGDHRLLCGDATDAKDVERLLDGRNPALLATDPPYGVDYANVLAGRTNQRKGGWDEIEGDDLDDEGLFALLHAVLSLSEAPTLFLWHSWNRVETNLRAVRACGWRPVSEIVWVKNALVFGRSDYQWRHECCIYAKRGGAPKQEDRTATTVWEFDKPTGGSHPTMKPVGVFEIPMRNHTKVGDVCYEPFAGSGSQFIAAEELRRRCFGMEIEPKFVAVTLERWQTATGRIPELFA